MFHRKFAIATAIAAVAVTATACCPATARLTAPAVQRPANAAVAAPGSKPACDPGVITVRVDQETPCDLIGGSNTLTVLGGTEADCDQSGGRWYYEACENVDF